MLTFKRNMPNTKRFLATALTIMAALATASATELSSVIGAWKITEIYDGPAGADPLEMPTTGGPFLFHFREKEGSTDSLWFYTKIGNNIRSAVQFTEGSDDVKFGALMSTQMMPGESLYRLETYLSLYLPKMTALTVSSDGQQLVLTGEGRIFCDAVKATDE